MNTKHSSYRSLLGASLAALGLCLCLSAAAQQGSSAQPIAISTPISESAAAAQKSFATAKEAARALLAGAEANDVAALVLLFGRGGQEIVTSGDPVQDRNHRSQFVTSAKKSLKLEHDPNHPNRVSILLGEDDYPFAVPIIRTNGR
jgi:hypothetical protein